MERPYGGSLGSRALASIHRRGYPKVETSAAGTRISDELGDVRHQMRTLAFASPLRITLLDAAAGETVAMQCTLRAPELRKPLTGELRIHVVARPAGLPPATDTADG